MTNNEIQDLINEFTNIQKKDQLDIDLREALWSFNRGKLGDNFKDWLWEEIIQKMYSNLWHSLYVGLSND